MRTKVTPTRLYSDSPAPQRRACVCVCVCTQQPHTHTPPSWLPQCWINTLQRWSAASPVLHSSPDGPELVALTPPTPPPFIKLGSDFNLTCSAVSSPATTFQWFRNQQLMENSGSTLTLKKIQELGLGSGTGQYSCGASNSKTQRAVSSAAVSFAVIGESPPTGGWRSCL